MCTKKVRAQLEHLKRVYILVVVTYWGVEWGKRGAGQCWGGLGFPPVGEVWRVSPHKKAGV